MYDELMKKAVEIEVLAADIREIAKKVRKLPDHWKVGQKVRALKDEEWAWSKGDILTIVEFHRDYPEGSLPADHYQVFYTARENGSGRCWTVPEQVELAEDV